MTKTSFIKKFVSIVVIIATLASLAIFTIPASAATSSSGKSSRTITVQTKANWWIPGSESITLSQTKGTCTESNYNIFKGKFVTKTSKQYGEWGISLPKLPTVPTL